MNSFNVIDLFCGCGGFSKGFENAGYKVILGIDNDDAALNTFEKNHNGAIGVNADLSDESVSSIVRDKANDNAIDVIIAGPPCQGFSLSGPRNFDDKRNKLYLAVINLVRELSPKAFIIENVPGMATLYNGQVKDEIIKRFTNIGYNVKCSVLCAADYGVPQMRKRLIFVGIKKELDFFEFPLPTHKLCEYVTCEQAISDLPSLENYMGGESEKYTLSQ